MITKIQYADTATMTILITMNTVELEPKHRTMTAYNSEWRTYLKREHFQDNFECIVSWIYSDGDMWSYEAIMFMDIEWNGGQFVCLFVWLCGMNWIWIWISVWWTAYVHVMLFAIRKDHEHNIRDCHHGILSIVGLLHCTPSTYEATTYMYSFYIEYHGFSRYGSSQWCNLNWFCVMLTKFKNLVQNHWANL